jgi:hypothetical protein
MMTYVIRMSLMIGILTGVLTACAGVRQDAAVATEKEPSACNGSADCATAAAAAPALPETQQNPLQPSPPSAPQSDRQDLQREPTGKPGSFWRAETTVAPAGKLLITGLSLEQNGLEIEASGPVRSYRVLTLTQPSRLVIEIKNGLSGFAQKSVPINRLGIATVSFENAGGVQRVILEGGSRMRLIPYRIQETASGLKVIVTDQ